MKKGYYKHWWFNSLIIAGLFGYSLYEYVDKIKIRNAAILDNYLIAEVQCTTDRNSSVIIVKGTKLYNIPIPWKECPDFSKGDSIPSIIINNETIYSMKGKFAPVPGTLGNLHRNFVIPFRSSLEYFHEKLMKAIK